MPTSSITHDFVIKDKKTAERLADALSMPKDKLPEPARTVSGKEEVQSLMEKWRKAMQEINDKADADITIDDGGGK